MFDVDFKYIDVEITKVFSEIWRFLNGFKIPIVGLTPGQFMLATMTLSLISLIVGHLIGMSSGVSFSASGALKEHKLRKQKLNQKNKQYYRHR